MKCATTAELRHEVVTLRNKLSAANTDKQEWISAHDMLPADATWVLIYADSEGANGKIVSMAFYQRQEYNDGVEHYWLCHNDTKNLSEWEGVTHWSPLPKAP